MHPRSNEKNLVFEMGQSNETFMCWAKLLDTGISAIVGKVWLAIQWGIIVLIAIAMWAFVRLASVCHFPG